MDKKNNKDPLKEIKCYIQPDRPLAFNFYEATTLEQLIDKEPTSGTKLVKKEEETKPQKAEDQSENTNVNMANEEEERPQQKVQVIEQYEGSLSSDNVGTKKNQETKNKGFQRQNDAKKEEQKKKIVIKYKKYTNSLNVSNNKLTTIAGIRAFLTSVLPELTFSSSINKVDLLQWIDISRNKLKEIHPEIASLRFLKILYVHGNNIQEIEKVLPLKDCKSLTSLTLYGNPIDHIKGYRHFIIEMCPILEKFDSAVISEKELDIIKFRGSRYGEKRDRAGNVIRYPKLPAEIIKTLQQLAEENNSDKKEE